MLRFIFFLVFAWLLVRLIRLVFYALTHSPTSPRASRKSYGVGTTSGPSPSAEFKDVQDAEFEELDDQTPK